MYFQSFARLAASLGVLLILTTASSLTALPAIPGLYELSFYASQGGVLGPVASLPVLSQELILVAHVEDTNGNPAQSGTVTFEYCSYNGLPPNDIDRADEAPKEACDAGLATWDRLGRRNISESCPSSLGPGNACWNFGIVRIPRDVGFRFKFAGSGKGGVDTGISAARNFTWTGGGAPSPTPTPAPTPTPTPTPTPDPTPGERTNFAFTSNGGVASASSEYSGMFPVTGANNGDRKGLNWENGGGWNDATTNAYPDWLQIDFNGSKTIDEINVFTIQDNYMNPSEPDLNMSFSQFGITHFDVQYWNGSDWVTVPGGSITDNNKVWSQISFSAVTTDKIRIQVNNSLASYSRIVEIEAWGSP